MIALQLLVILQVIVILFTPISCYPIYGTKRYGRSSTTSNNHHQWNGPSYPMVRPQRYPINYYELYPYYSQNYPDDSYYYNQDNLPVYYPIPRTSKYEVYQAVLPYYYYYDRPTTTARPNNYYYDDPVVNLQEELLEEDEQQQQPIGHELFYENDDETINNNNDNYDDVNAAFLQNLIMSQMYNDYNYGKWEDGPVDDDDDDDDRPNYSQEDEDVRELKQLAKPHANKHDLDNIYWYQRLRNQKDEKRSLDEKKLRIFTDRKPIIKQSTTTTTTTTTPTTVGKAKNGGQKEEVLMRPATPVRHPFSEPILEMISNQNNKIVDNNKRSPSVYDTIKHMLDMEKSLDKYGVDEIRPQMKKRIISSEDSLTQQLSVLKKSH